MVLPREEAYILRTHSECEDVWLRIRTPAMAAIDAVGGSHHWHRDVPNRGYCYEAAYVSLWLEAEIRRSALRGPVSAQKQTLANRFSEAVRFTSGYRSKADAVRLRR